MFCAMLGERSPGNLALTLGSFGGVYIAGGIVPKLGDRYRPLGLPRPLRRQGTVPRLSRFESRPGWMTHPLPGVPGLKAVLDDQPPIA